jgi:hypothetical protein
MTGSDRPMQQLSLVLRSERGTVGKDLCARKGATDRCERDCLRLVLRLSKSNEIPAAFHTAERNVFVT